MIIGGETQVPYQQNWCFPSQMESKPNSSAHSDNGHDFFVYF